ncbi:hypothetical protein AHAS_Ahas20G0320700 [Arachis hypogaea]
MVFLPLPLNGWSFDYYLSNKVIYGLLPKLKQLRVLSLSHYKNISELQDSIGALKHLRHLDLSGTNIKRLPSVVCKLYNLQSLLLSDCKFLTESPEEIGMLTAKWIKVGELQKFPNLQGKLCISKLQNIVDLVPTSCIGAPAAFNKLEQTNHLILWWNLVSQLVRRFWVSYCNKLNSLPEPVNALVGLQELTVLNLPSCSKLFVNHACEVVGNLL